MMLPKSFTIKTKNLKLRIPSAVDIPHIFEATKIEGFNDGMAWEPPTNEDELIAPLQRSIESWETGNGYSFTVEDKINGIFLGRTSIRKTKELNVWNIGFFTHPAHQGKGIMTETVAALLHFGFTKLGAIRIEAEYAIWNKGSEKVLQKNGMIFVKFIKEGLLKNGEWVAENRVAIDYAEWERNNVN